MQLHSLVCSTFCMMERWSYMQPYFGGLGISHGEYSLPCALLPTHKKELLVLQFIHYHERVFMLSEWKRATDSYGRNFHLLKKKKNPPYEENR